MKSILKIVIPQFFLLGGVVAGEEQAIQFVPDHAYIWVSSGAPEAAVLRELGINQWSQAVDSGEGTMLTGFQFENFFLELIWVSDELVFQQEWVSWHAAHQERANWKTTGASPFGLAFHIENSGDYSVPDSFRVENWWDEQGGYVQEADARLPFLMLMGPRHAMPDPSWMTPEDRALADNPAGIRKLTGWTLHSPHRFDTEVLDTLVKQGALRVQSAPGPILELTFDNKRQEKRFDARPQLPLIINY